MLIILCLYAATKTNELIAHIIVIFKLPTTGLRFFTVYGLWGNLIWHYKFTDLIMKNKPIRFLTGI